MMRQDDLPLFFGQRVRSLRIDQRLSQAELAKRCGLDRTYISSLEQGRRNVSLVNIGKIAVALNIPLTKLFDGITIDVER
jgi:transcriptional regulator with XRE-family HTH domain